MYLKYRCKDIIGKYLLKFCVLLKLSILMEYIYIGIVCWFDNL